jgi:hypothetical protein
MFTQHVSPDIAMALLALLAVAYKEIAQATDFLNKLVVALFTAFCEVSPEGKVGLIKVSIFYFCFFVLGGVYQGNDALEIAVLAVLAAAAGTTSSLIATLGFWESTKKSEFRKFKFLFATKIGKSAGPEL